MVEGISPKLKILSILLQFFFATVFFNIPGSHNYEKDEFPSIVSWGLINGIRSVLKVIDSFTQADVTFIVDIIHQ